VTDANNMNKVEIYTSNFCGYCLAAKALLKYKGLKYKAINVSSDPDLKTVLMEKYNWRTIPLIIINNKVIGGFEQLLALESRGHLDKLLNEEVNTD